MHGHLNVRFGVILFSLIHPKIKKNRGIKNERINSTANKLIFNPKETISGRRKTSIIE